MLPVFPALTKKTEANADVENTTHTHILKTIVITSVTKRRKEKIKNTPPLRPVLVIDKKTKLTKIG